MESNDSPTPEEAEAEFRALVDRSDLPQPDRVSYDASRRELMLRWDMEEIVVVVELDEEEPEDLAA